MQRRLRRVQVLTTRSLAFPGDLRSAAAAACDRDVALSERHAAVPALHSLWSGYAFHDSKPCANTAHAQDVTFPSHQPPLDRSLIALACVARIKARLAHSTTGLRLQPIRRRCCASSVVQGQPRRWPLDQAQGGQGYGNTQGCHKAFRRHREGVSADCQIVQGPLISYSRADIGRVCPLDAKAGHSCASSIFCCSGRAVSRVTLLTLDRYILPIRTS